MKILALFFLGFVQGLTEFLPISSSGHLALFSKLFGLEENMFVSILLHVATLLSILVFFRKDVWEMIKHPFSKEAMLVCYATIPTCIVVLLLMPLIKMSFGGSFLSICFLISGAILLCADNLPKQGKNGKIDAKTAIFMGFLQGVAGFPGISRSGITLSAGLARGKDKKETARFAFLMSIPVILASMTIEIVEIAKGKIRIPYPCWALVFAFLIAFVIGLFAIKFVIKMAEKSKLKWFAFYLFGLSVVTLFLL